ncbi:hypothetical protein J2787_003480 [Chryseobacterium rhizosphaerae]|uniref:Uncharacterized protein n=1 Tax=Chryseobacterium rhizosphaerae TaxID=395937 RepID=A0AAE4C2Z5_9FLAO|nr:hypothetical protein [Chryseobacterium rhizosphaerae]MDR6528061.1 hypothetical protein [Chryseobacterium rhizosphaerae]
MIFTEDFFAPGSSFPNDDLIQLVDSTTYENVNFKKITHWYDNTPMDDSKADNVVYRKKGNDYYVRIYSNGNEYLEKDTMDEMCNLTDTEILLLEMKFYKGIRLSGYYVKGDTPAPINYYLSASTAPDNKGSLVTSGSIRLFHQFTREVDVSYFGAKQDNVTDNAPKFQEAANLKLPLSIRNLNQHSTSNSTSESYYLIKSKVRLFNSAIGHGFPKLKVTDAVNTFFRNPDEYFRYSIFYVANKVCSDYIEISGFHLDGAWNGVHEGSEQEAPIVVVSSNNVKIFNNTIENALGDCIQIYWHTIDGVQPLQLYCKNIQVYDNVLLNPLRANVAVISGVDINIERNHMEKAKNFVAAIDLEMDKWEDPGQLMRNIFVDKNYVYAPTCDNAISCLGVQDGLKGISITNNVLICSETSGRAINLEAGYGLIEDVYCFNNKVKCLLALRLTGEKRVKNVTLQKTSPVEKNGQYVLANIGWSDDVKIINNYSKIDKIYHENIMCGGKDTRNVLIEGNTLESVQYRNICLISQNENVIIQNNVLKFKYHSIDTDPFVDDPSTATPYCNNVRISTNIFNSTDSLQVAFRAAIANIKGFYFSNDNILNNVIGNVSNQELITISGSHTTATRKYHGFLGDVKYNTDTQQFEVFRGLNNWGPI